MSCQECDALIYTYPESTAKEKEPLEAHLLTCISCREKFDAFLQQQSLMQTLGSTIHRAANEDKVMENIMAEVRKDKRSVTPRRALTGWLTLQPLRYAAATISVVLVGVFVFELVSPDGAIQRSASTTPIPIGTRAARLITAGFITARNNEKEQPEKTSLKELAYCSKQLQSSGADQSCNACKKCKENPFN